MRGSGSWVACGTDGRHLGEEGQVDLPPAGGSWTQPSKGVNREN